MNTRCCVLFLRMMGVVGVGLSLVSVSPQSANAGDAKGDDQPCENIYKDKEKTEALFTCSKVTQTVQEKDDEGVLQTKPDGSAKLVALPPMCVCHPVPKAPQFGDNVDPQSPMAACFEVARFAGANETAFCVDEVEKRETEKEIAACNGDTSADGAYVKQLRKYAEGSKAAFRDAMQDMHPSVRKLLENLCSPEKMKVKVIRTIKKGDTTEQVTTEEERRAAVDLSTVTRCYVNALKVMQNDASYFAGSVCMDSSDYTCTRDQRKTFLDDMLPHKDSKAADCDMQEFTNSAQKTCDPASCDLYFKGVEEGKEEAIANCKEEASVVTPEVCLQQMVAECKRNKELRRWGNFLGPILKEQCAPNDTDPDMPTSKCLDNNLRAINDQLIDAHHEMMWASDEQARWMVTSNACRHDYLQQKSLSCIDGGGGSSSKYSVCLDDSKQKFKDAGAECEKDEKQVAAIAACTKMAGQSNDPKAKASDDEALLIKKRTCFQDAYLLQGACVKAKLISGGILKIDGAEDDDPYMQTGKQTYKDCMQVAMGQDGFQEPEEKKSAKSKKDEEPTIDSCRNTILGAGRNQVNVTGVVAEILEEKIPCADFGPADFVPAEHLKIKYDPFYKLRGLTGTHVDPKRVNEEMPRAYTPGMFHREADSSSPTGKPDPTYGGAGDSNGDSAGVEGRGTGHGGKDNGPAAAQKPKETPPTAGNSTDPNAQKGPGVVQDPNKAPNANQDPNTDPNAKKGPKDPKNPDAAVGPTTKGADPDGKEGGDPNLKKSTAGSPDGDANGSAAGSPDGDKTLGSSDETPGGKKKDPDAKPNWRAKLFKKKNTEDNTPKPRNSGPAGGDGSEEDRKRPLCHAFDKPEDPFVPVEDQWKDCAESDRCSIRTYGRARMYFCQVEQKFSDPSNPRTGVLASFGIRVAGMIRYYDMHQDAADKVKLKVKGCTDELLKQTTIQIEEIQSLLDAVGDDNKPIVDSADEIKLLKDLISDVYEIQALSCDDLRSSQKDMSSVYNIYKDDLLKWQREYVGKSYPTDPKDIRDPKEKYEGFPLDGIVQGCGVPKRSCLPYDAMRKTEKKPDFQPDGN